MVLGHERTGARFRFAHDAMFLLLFLAEETQMGAFQRFIESGRRDIGYSAAKGLVYPIHRDAHRRQLQR